ncbi:hypothetical protein [Desulfocicer niacini]
MVLRLMGLKKFPDVSTISKGLSQLGDKNINNIQYLSRNFVVGGCCGQIITGTISQAKPGF